MAEPARRRLTVIVAADVCGYSRLIAADEEGTLAALRAHRIELIDPRVEEYEGRIANTAGDSLLIEFQSVVEALRFSIAIHNGIAERNANVPQDQQVLFRIGINLGDVVEQDGDLLGDGVNVAARIEALAEPGSIYMSSAAFDQIGAKVDVGFEDLGEQVLKNIPKSVRVYRVNLDSTGLRPPPRKSAFNTVAISAAVLLFAALGAGLWWAKPLFEYSAPKKPSSTAAIVEEADRPVIAVMPFANMSKDTGEEYFSDGITEDLITDLSNVSGLLVIARNSTVAYKGTSPDVRKVGRELGVQYVVEGSVRRVAGRVRINAQLIDAKSGSHLWAERYDREFKDVFSLQDEVIGKIVAQLAVALTPDEERRLMRPLSSNPEAYDLYLQGLQQESYFTKEGNENSQRLFLRAIELDPGFASAHARLGQAYSLAIENRWTHSPEQVTKKALDAALKGVRLDDELPYAYWSLGRVYSRSFISELDKSKDALSKAITLNPNYADGYAQLAYTLVFKGEAAQAFGAIEKAMRINPRFPFWYLQILGMAQFFTGSYEAAAKSLRQAAERNPNVPWTRRYLLACYGELGKKAEAEWEITEIEALGQPISIQAFLKSTPIRDPDYRKMYENALRKAGLPE